MIESEEQIKKALIKKAIGYNTKETAEEYVFSDGEEILNKRKVMIKHFSPDISAIKVFLLYYGEKGFEELNALSEEDLEMEKLRLINYLKNKPESAKNDNNFVEKVKETLQS